ncbi:MAG: hypothetical protein ACRDRJ_53905, partial [Streptosporangiaceae bacterium]
CGPCAGPPCDRPGRPTARLREGAQLTRSAHRPGRRQVPGQLRRPEFRYRPAAGQLTEAAQALVG